MLCVCPTVVMPVLRVVPLQTCIAVVSCECLFLPVLLSRTPPPLGERTGSQPIQPHTHTHTHTYTHTHTHTHAHTYPHSNVQCHSAPCNAHQTHRISSLCLMFRRTTVRSSALLLSISA